MATDSAFCPVIPFQTLPCLCSTYVPLEHKHTVVLTRPPERVSRKRGLFGFPFHLCNIITKDYLTQLYKTSCEERTHLWRERNVCINLCSPWTNQSWIVYNKLMKKNAPRKHSLHEKTAASVLLKLFISSNQ